MIFPVLAALLGVAADQPAFDPLLDRPYQVAFDDERADASGVRHFHLDRTVTFSREPDGLLAAVTLVAVTTDASGEVGRRFLIGAGALKGRTVRFHLDRNGSVRAIDEEAAVWAAIVGGVAAIGSSGSSQVGGVASAPAAPLAALPPDKVREVIASVIAPIVAGPVPAQGSRPVTLPTRGIFSAAGAPIAGVETVTRSADARLHVTTQATSSQGDTRLAIDRTHVIDPARGLVLSTEDVQTATVSGATQTIRSRVRVTPPVF